MQLTTYTDYALRMVMYLAAHDEDESLHSIKQISTAYSISYNHLTKVGHELSKLGVIHTVKGRNGGIRLAKEPEEINIGWLVRQTEDNLTLVECFDPESNQCILAGRCRLQGVLGEALKAYLSVLDKYTVKDITVNKEMLHGLFAASTAKNQPPISFS